MKKKFISEIRKNKDSKIIYKRTDKEETKYDEEGREIYSKSESLETQCIYSENKIEIINRTIPDNKIITEMQELDTNGNVIYHVEKCGDEIINEQKAEFKDGKKIETDLIKGTTMTRDCDEKGRIIHEIQQDGCELFNEYDDNDNVIYQKFNGIEVHNEYDVNNNIIHQKVSNGMELTMKYDERGNLIYQESNSGFKGWTEYDDNNFPIVARYSTGTIDRFITTHRTEGDINIFMLYKIEEENNIDDINIPEIETDSNTDLYKTLGNGKINSKTILMIFNKYDDAGRKIYSKHSSEGEFYYQYDDKDRCICKYNDAFKEIYKYDDRGNIIYTKDSDGFEVQQVYTEDNKVQLYKDSKGYMIHCNYDDKGRLIYKQENGNNSLYSYDENGVNTQTIVNGVTIFNKYDDRGNIIEAKCKIYEKYIEYNNQDSPIHILEKNLKDNTTEEHWTEYDEHGEVLYLKSIMNDDIVEGKFMNIYDDKGHLIKVFNVF